jgi:hypothetical protein
MFHSRICGVERARKCTHGAIVQALDDRSTKRIVLLIHGPDVAPSLVSCIEFACLHECREPHHVGEHDCDESTLESISHRIS